MTPIGDPHICILPSPPDETSPSRWVCRQRCERTWHLEWFMFADGQVAGPSWILDHPNILILSRAICPADH